MKNQWSGPCMIHHILTHSMIKFKYKRNCGLLEERSGFNIRGDAWLNLRPFFTWFIVITRPWFNNTFSVEEIGLARSQVAWTVSIVSVQCFGTIIVNDFRLLDTTPVSAFKSAAKAMRYISGNDEYCLRLPYRCYCILALVTIIMSLIVIFHDDLDEDHVSTRIGQPSIERNIIKV